MRHANKSAGDSAPNRPEAELLRRKRRSSIDRGCPMLSLIGKTKTDRTRLSLCTNRRRR